jgi:hypothetical protein
MNPLSRVIPRPIRHFLHVLLIALALVMLTATALAAQPLTGTFSAQIRGREVTYLQNGKPIHRWAGLYNLKLDSGEDVPVYCVQFGVRVNYGDRYRSDGPIQQLPNGCQIRYLLNKYPASTANTPDEAAARQLAIWSFSDNVDPTTITGTTTLRDRVIALVNEAHNAPCPATRAEIPDLTLEPPTASAQAGQTVTYTVRVAPPGIAPSVNIAVSGPATLAGGRQQASIPLNAAGVATFGVTGVGAGDSDISASLPYQLDSGVVFSPIDDTHKTQRLVMADKHNFAAKAAARALWTGGAPPPQITPTQPAPQQPTSTPKPRKKGPRPTEQPPTPTPTPEVTPEVAAAAPTPTLVATAAAAGGAPPQPRQLPRTGAPDDAARWLGMGIAALLLAIGISLRWGRLRR